MPTQTYSTFSFADTTLRYQLDDQSGAIGLELFPTVLEGQLATRRQLLLESPEDALPGIQQGAAFQVNPLVHVKIVGDAYTGGFAQGRSMQNGVSQSQFCLSQQKIEEENGQITVVTTLQSAAGYALEHRLTWREGETAFHVQTSFINDSNAPVTLEMMSSFSLGGITPFHRADAPHRLQVHRFRSVWSAEGRLETRTLEELHLERSWSGSGINVERFGQVGSMPVRGWFPFVAIEDTAANAVWGAQLAWAGSWQMEIVRQHDPVSITGGLADREFGHWTKTLAPGEKLVAPPAVLACVAGDLDDLCDALTQTQQSAADLHPASEADLPILFNEWCTTWGEPSHERVTNIARVLKGSPVKTLVIDAGWFRGEVGEWHNAQGDWTPSNWLFPEGLEKTAAAIREEGLIPGIWFEWEVVGPNSTVFPLTDHLLKRDGVPITVGQRRFWDLNDAFAVDYLTERVIGLLKRCNFGYLKVDYNETIGIGCEGAESLGEGLRRQIEGIYRFFERMRREIPELVIENCSSGGHRLEPSMLALTAMSSFSDAHETVEIPIIAANLHRLMLPRQSQIWAVLNADNSEKRLIYSLAATFLGRMCLSGEVDLLSAAQWEIVHRAQELYSYAAPIIKHGKSRHFGQKGASWRHPQGWQAVRRVADDDHNALVVLHAFQNAPQSVEIALPYGNWTITAQLKGNAASIQGNQLRCTVEGDWSAQVILLSCCKKIVL